MTSTSASPTHCDCCEIQPWIRLLLQKWKNSSGNEYLGACPPILTRFHIHEHDFNRYPEVALQHTHRCRAYIPRDIAVALSVEPSLVQRAVETFYARDATQLRVCIHAYRACYSLPRDLPSYLGSAHYVKISSLNIHPRDSLYDTACLRSTRRPEIPSAKSLRSLGGERGNSGMEDEGCWDENCECILLTKREKTLVLITPKACGFEMLYAESKTRSLAKDAAGTEQNVGRLGGYRRLCATDSFYQMAAIKDALKRDKEYQQYIRSLQSASYFGGEVEGSSEWNTLETRAATMWLDMRRKT